MLKKNDYIEQMNTKLSDLKSNGLFKNERVISSPQGSRIQTVDGEVINLCSNNYLGLANHPRLVEAAKEYLGRYGFGLSSVRFICGTQDLHKQLEAALSDFLGTEDTILYSSCFDANGGLFETLFEAEDAIISDALNHASIIDGIRLSKSKRYRYSSNNMEDLEKQLQQAQADKARFCLIATDGVFSMDGYIANLADICKLAEHYNALVMVDDSHAVGFMGANGRGTPEHCKVMDKIDLITGTLGKALGGASGGYISGRKELISWLRQRSRPYLFSNTLAPVITGTSLEVLKLIKDEPSLRARLFSNAAYFRAKMAELGINLVPGEHPIIPVMLGDAQLASRMSELLLKEGVYVVGFSFPVVPMGAARIRTQMSAALSEADLDLAVAAFKKVGQNLGVIN
ncbi:MAG: glycine C-acetyltransferase [Oligoflexales bacterium]|nr:glycine C-acetyltransferase [Oligoflexales bacterium]